MKLNYLAFVLPIFFLFVGLEYCLSVKKKRNTFSFGDTISNLNVGIFERTCDLFTTTMFHFFFVWLYNNYAIFNIKANFVTWILLFLATDLLWYWYHRFGHTVNILWSAHVVHHQSEDFNFTVAARITVFQAFFRVIFWSFIPILGFPPEMITTILLIHGAYPFFTHTQLVGKLGFLERIIVTPSHHRVHHSCNEQYLDKNFGDMLIIWDKIFGTYIEEDEQEQAVYGITSPLKSHSFLWQHFHFLLEIIVAFNRSIGFKAKWKTVFGLPDNIDPAIRGELEQKLLTQEPKRRLSEKLIAFITVNTAFSLLFVFFFLLFGYYQSGYELLLGGLFIFFSVIHTGAMLEQRRWIFHIEFIRLVVFVAYVGLVLPQIWISLLITIAVAVLSLFYETANKRYVQLLTVVD